MSYDLGTAHGKIVLDYNGDRAVDAAERDIDRLSRKAKESDGHLGKLGKTLGGLGKGVALTGLVASLTNAAAQAAAIGIQILGVVPALASLLSLSAAIPGAFLAGVAAVGVLKAAFAGVGETIKAAFGDDPAKFNEALKKLAPEARETAKAFREMVPFLKSVQKGIQDAFFSNNFEDFFPSLLGGIRSVMPSLAGLARDFGNLGREIAAATVGRDAFWELLDNSIISVRGSLRQLTPAIQPIIKGLLDVGAVGLPLLDRLGAAVASNAGRFGSWMQQIAASGQLQQWIDTALQTLSELGQIIGNVGAILNAVFKAAQATGGGLLGTLAEITGEARRFLESAEGSAAITELFASILSVARQLAPIFTTLAGALASALAPALAKIATGVGPELLKVVQALAPAFGPLAMAIADVAVALAPLLPPLAQLVSLLVQQLAGGLSALAAELGPVIALFGGTLLQAFQRLTPLVARMVSQVLPLAAAFGQDLLTALAPLAPVIIELADAFVSALAPAMPQIIAASRALIPAIVSLAEALSGQLIIGLRAIIPIIPPLVAGFVSLATTAALVIAFFTNVGAAIIRFNATVNSAVGLALAVLMRIPQVIGNALLTAQQWLMSVGASIGTWFAGLAPKIGAALAALPGIVGNAFRRAIELAAQALGAGAGILVGIAVTFPRRIASAVAALPGLLAGVIRNAWNTAKSIFTGGVNSSASTAASLPSRVASAIRGLIGQLRSIATSAWNALKSAFSSGVSAAASIARSLPGRVKGALGNVGGLLVGAGQAIINGLIRGISSGIGRVLGMVRGLASQVQGAFSSALKIFSPSKVFFRFGVNIDQGLIAGIKDKLREVLKASGMLANAVIKPSVVMGRDALPYSPAQTLARINPTNEAGADRPQSFGPYEMVLDGGVVTAFVIDTITGNPTVVSKASNEGARKSSFSGSGRVTANA